MMSQSLRSYRYVCTIIYLNGTIGSLFICNSILNIYYNFSKHTIFIWQNSTLRVLSLAKVHTLGRGMQRQKRGQNGGRSPAKHNILILYYQADKGQAIPWHEPSLSQRSIDSNSPLKRESNNNITFPWYQAEETEEFSAAKQHKKRW